MSRPLGPQWREDGGANQQVNSLFSDPRRQLVLSPFLLSKRSRTGAAYDGSYPFGFVFDSVTLALWEVGR